MNVRLKVRPSPIAGTWYPSNPAALTRQLDRYLDQAQIDIPAGTLWGVMVPHAGYTYSGPVAAYAFKCLYGLRPDLIVVVSPFHASHRDPLLTTAYQAYGTPLGAVEVDTRAVSQLNDALQNKLGQGLTPLEEEREHSLEIELPFLQHIFGQFQLLPIMVRNQRTRVATALGQTLAEVLRGRQVLFVASSDLSHFYPQKAACRLDAELLRRLELFDPMGVMDAEEEGVGFACGRGAIAAVLWASRQLGANRVSVLHHATSGDVSGDYEAVVGYGAAAIWQAPDNGKQVADGR